MTAPDLHTFTDLHAHTRIGPDVLTSVEPDAPRTGEYGEAWYSVGIHPWSTAEPVSEATLQALDSAMADPRVVAVGECGLDKLRGGSAVVQEALFRHHAALSERHGKPLIIHCVGRYGRLMELRAALKPTQTWIIHGFRGKPELARQLVAAGFGLSLGRKSDSSLRDILPLESIYSESDA